VLTGSERVLGAPRDALQNLLMSERERGRLGRAELADDARPLGLGPDGTLGALSDDADDAFLGNALAFALRAAVTQPEANAALDALHVLAQARRSGAAMAEHPRRRARRWMTRDATYRALGAKDSADDETLCWNGTCSSRFEVAVQLFANRWSRLENSCLMFSLSRSQGKQASTKCERIHGRHLLYYFDQVFVPGLSRLCPEPQDSGAQVGISAVFSAVGGQLRWG
jgi:hypothetical protein